MTFIDLIGYLASALVLATFCMRDMRALRWLAVASNLAFVAYGAMAGLGPVLVLHVLLLPLNLARLREIHVAARQKWQGNAATRAKAWTHLASQQRAARVARRAGSAPDHDVKRGRGATRSLQHPSETS